MKDCLRCYPTNFQCPTRPDQWSKAAIKQTKLNCQSSSCAARGLATFFFQSKMLRYFRMTINKPLLWDKDNLRCGLLCLIQQSFFPDFYCTFQQVRSNENMFAWLQACDWVRPVKRRQMDRGPGEGGNSQRWILLRVELWVDRGCGIPFSRCYCWVDVLTACKIFVLIATVSLICRFLTKYFSDGSLVGLEIEILFVT